MKEALFSLTISKSFESSEMSLIYLKTVTG